MPAKPKPATKFYAEGPQNKDADPSAPAGMTRSDIRVELAEEHGVNMNTTRDLALPSLVDMLVQSRLSAENDDKRGVPRLKDRAEPKAENAEFTSPTGQTARVVRHDTDLSENAAHKQVNAVLDESLCKHGEDPVLCEACEDELLGDDLDDYDEAEDAGFEADHPDEPEPEPEPEDAKIAPLIEQSVENAAAVPTTEESMEDEDDWYDSVQTERDEHEAAAPESLFLGMPGLLDYTFNHHSGVGPSAAARWMNCTASLGMSQRFLRNLSDSQQREFASGSMAARQGTTAHAAAEVEARVMLGEYDANEAEHLLFELAIDPPAGEDYTPEMAEFITEYTDLVKGFVDDGHEVLIEARVLAAVPLTMPMTLESREYIGLEPGDDDYYVIPGSVDCGVLPTDDEKVLTAVDLKYGEGKDVDPDSNPQVRIYMLGLLAKFIEDGGDPDDLERLDYIIAQPRLGGIKAWTESVNDLLTWRDEVLAPALTAALGLAPSEFSPGEETCQWCPARGGCVALADARVSAATELFTALDDAEFEGGPALVAADLDNDRLASLLKQITGLTDLQADLRAEAQRRMYRGDKVPGMLLVNYTPPRAWKPDAEAFFRDEDNEHLPAWNPPTLRTPTQFVKALAGEFKGKNAKEREAAAQAKFSRLIDVPDKRPVPAFDGDKRTPWQGKAPDEMFDVIEDEG